MIFFLNYNNKKENPGRFLLFYFIISKPKSAPGIFTVGGRVGRNDIRGRGPLSPKPRPERRTHKRHKLGSKKKNKNNTKRKRFD